MPTIKNISNGFRSFFFSFDCNEFMHVRVSKGNMVCKFWIEPIALAKNYGFSAKELNKIMKIIKKKH
ncbi:MAG TPA: DUF4160 domain-containing protein [Ignavibacteria bacterium]|nr:DUF4160 domain-containing protein [Ignavibacteria bacterium]